MYVAGRVLKVVRDGETVDVQVGEPVPECTTWSTFKACLNTGHIVWQPESGKAMPPPGVPASAVQAIKTAPIVEASKKTRAKKAG